MYLLIQRAVDIWHISSFVCSFVFVAFVDSVTMYILLHVYLQEIL